MKEENAEDGVRIERFFRPDPRVRQCRPGTRKPNGRGRWSRLSGRRVAGLTRRGCHRKMGCVYHNAAALKPGIAFPLTLEQCFRVAGLHGLLPPSPSQHLCDPDFHSDSVAAMEWQRETIHIPIIRKILSGIPDCPVQYSGIPLGYRKTDKRTADSVHGPLSIFGFRTARC